MILMQKFAFSTFLHIFSQNYPIYIVYYITDVTLLYNVMSGVNNCEKRSGKNIYEYMTHLHAGNYKY